MTVSAPIARVSLVCPHGSFGLFSTTRGASPIFSFGAGWMEENRKKFLEYGGYRHLESGSS
jgi:hypothetical protein